MMTLVEYEKKSRAKMVVIHVDNHSVDYEAKFDLVVIDQP